MLPRVKSVLVELGIKTGVHKQLYEFASPSTSSAVCLVISDSIGLSFLVLGQKTGALFALLHYEILPVPLGTK